MLGEPEFADGVRARARRATSTRARRRREPRAIAGAATRAAPGIAGLLADLVASGEPVLAVVAHAPHRARDPAAAAIGGFAICSWAALEDDPELAAPFAHLVAVDPPVERPPARACSNVRPAGRASPSGVG